jgi:outer membrane murein-binding lipoprotein Lpp
LSTFARAAPGALVLLVGCAGGGDALRRDLDAVRSEVRALRSDNEDLSRRLEALAGRVDAASARAPRAAGREVPPSAPAAPPSPLLVPPDLAVVRVEPPSRGGRPPPVPTAVPIAEPDAERLEALGRRGGREISADAEDELRRARKLGPVARAHALEDFVARYPRHPSADNALVEGSAAYAEAGRGEAACDLARRASADYPAGDAMSDALERLAWCESRRGSADAERRLLERLVSDFPRTPAAERAGTRLATISGHTGDTPPNGPARSGP